MTQLETLARMYVMSRLTPITSPMPHLVGPPGCGKSTDAKLLAEMFDVNLHIINVSRLSPLEIEGVQMPLGLDGDDPRLHMLPATFWTQLKDGDILLFEEFLNGFPEVYHGLLDIFTSRRVGAFHLPNVFIMGASNSVTAASDALSDRLLHLPVPDIRTNKKAATQLKKVLVDQMGLHSVALKSTEMTDLVDGVIAPAYAILDVFKGSGTNISTKSENVKSPRHLIGLVQMRQFDHVPQLVDLVSASNQAALADRQGQHYIIHNEGSFKAMPSMIRDSLPKLNGHSKLSPQEQFNVASNLQLIEMYESNN